MNTMRKTLTLAAPILTLILIAALCDSGDRN